MKRSHIFLSLLCAALLCGWGCGQYEAPEDGWYRRVLSGQLQPVPFSHDLELIGFTGWRFIGKLPRRAAQADAIQVSLWHDTYEGEIEPDLLVSHAPAEEEYSGAWTGKNRDLRRVEVDILVRRSLDDGYPVFSYRAVVNGVERSQRLEVPQGSRFQLELSPADPVPLTFGEPIAIAEATIEGWAEKKEEEATYMMKRRTFRWFVRFDAVKGED